MKKKPDTTTTKKKTPAKKKAAQKTTATPADTREFRFRLYDAMKAAGLHRDRPRTARILESSESSLEKWLSGRITPHVLTQEAALARLTSAEHAYNAEQALKAVRRAHAAIQDAENELIALGLKIHAAGTGNNAKTTSPAFWAAHSGGD